jgi:hypothetical protein
VSLHGSSEAFPARAGITDQEHTAQRAHLFKEGVEKGYFIKRANGDVWQ